MMVSELREKLASDIIPPRCEGSGRIEKQERKLRRRFRLFNNVALYDTPRRRVEQKRIAHLHEGNGQSDW